MCSTATGWLVSRVVIRRGGGSTRRERWGKRGRALRGLPVSRRKEGGGGGVPKAGNRDVLNSLEQAQTIQKRMHYYSI